MRGDSRCDLYAKCLALCGLALLAGAGALVDYWPVQDELPRVAARRPEPFRLQLPRVDANAVVQVAAVAEKSTASARRRNAAHAARPTLRTDVPASLDVPVMASLDPAVQSAEPWVMSAPPAPLETPTVHSLPVAVAATAVVPVASVDLPNLSPASLDLVGLTGHADDDTGFLSGAFRKTGAVASASIAKTGDAIVKGGAIAGTSIIDMFRGLAGAVKRVTPFFP